MKKFYFAGLKIFLHHNRKRIFVSSGIEISVLSKNSTRIWSRSKVIDDDCFGDKLNFAFFTYLLPELFLLVVPHYLWVALSSAIYPPKGICIIYKQLRKVINCIFPVDYKMCMWASALRLFYLFCRSVQIYCDKWKYFPVRAKVWKTSAVN